MDMDMRRHDHRTHRHTEVARAADAATCLQYQEVGGPRSRDPWSRSYTVSAACAWPPLARIASGSHAARPSRDCATHHSATDPSRRAHSRNDLLGVACLDRGPPTAASAATPATAAATNWAAAHAEGGPGGVGLLPGVGTLGWVALGWGARHGQRWRRAWRGGGGRARRRRRRRRAARRAGWEAALAWLAEAAAASCCRPVRALPLCERSVAPSSFGEAVGGLLAELGLEGWRRRRGRRRRGRGDGLPRLGRSWCG